MNYAGWNHIKLFKYKQYPYIIKMKGNWKFDGTKEVLKNLSIFPNFTWTQLSWLQVQMYWCIRRDRERERRVPILCNLSHLWWHISAINCQIIMSTCQIFMLTCQLFMSTSQIIMSTCQKNNTTTRSLINSFYSVLMPLTAIYLSIKYLTSRPHYLTSWHNDLTSWHNY